MCNSVSCDRSFLVCKYLKFHVSFCGFCIWLGIKTNCNKPLKSNKCNSTRTIVHILLVNYRAILPFDFYLFGTSLCPQIHCNPYAIFMNYDTLWEVITTLYFHQIFTFFNCFHLLFTFWFFNMNSFYYWNIFWEIKKNMYYVSCLEFCT